MPNCTALLACQTGILNHDAQVRWKMGVDRLPDNAGLAQVAFEQFSCSACLHVDDSSPGGTEGSLHGACDNEIGAGASQWAGGACARAHAAMASEPPPAEDTTCSYSSSASESLDTSGVAEDETVAVRGSGSPRKSLGSSLSLPCDAE